MDATTVTRHIRTTVSTLVALVALVACTPNAGTFGDNASTSSDNGGTSSQSTTPASAALEALETLEVKGKASGSAYDADSYGWREDTDRNGCDTRNDVLRRDLTRITLKARTNGCVVTTGTLADPYSGTDLAFTDPSVADIDHVVARKAAEVTGAETWTAERKAEFANDPLNLLAVDASLNRQKGDGDAATWLPPNKAFRCDYVARQVAVKVKYRLWVAPAEHDAMERVLQACPGEVLPAADDVQWPAPGGGDVAGEAPRPEPAASAPVPSDSTTPGESAAPAAGGAEVTYGSCREAREAGAAPLRRGEPGYSESMDGDGDGVACE